MPTIYLNKKPKVSEEIIKNINVLISSFIFNHRFINKIDISNIFNQLDIYENKYNITLYYEESIKLIINYINKLKEEINIFNYQQIFIICLIIAQKVNDDTPFRNKDYALIFPRIFKDYEEKNTPLQKLNNGELEVLKLLEWNVFENELETI